MFNFATFPREWGTPPLSSAARRDWIRSHIQLSQAEARATGIWPAWLSRPDGEPGTRPDAALRMLELHELEMLWQEEAASPELRSAIGIHHTDIVDMPWYGAINEGHLKSGDVASFRKMYAWYDPNAADPNGDGYPDSKSAWSLPHHEVTNGGRVGPANLDACSGGIAVLNGARGGTGIPQDERPDVWLHLATHLRDAGVSQPPALRMARMPGGIASRHLRNIARGW